jgi:hypothetical protein
VNVVDQVELAYLDYSGSIDIATLAGNVLREQLEFAAWLFNVPVEMLLEHLEAK